MGERAPKYWLVALVFAVGAAVTYWSVTRPAPDVFSADLESMPSSLGPWSGAKVGLDPEVEALLNADEAMFRQYRHAESEQTVALLAVYRKYGRREFAHRPEMCYPAAGFEIISRGYSTMPFAGRTIPVYKVVAQKGTDREIIVYWFASGERTEASYVKQQVWMALDRLRAQKYGWAFIRLNSPVMYSDDDTLDAMREFMRKASGPLAQTLTTSHKRG